MLLSSLGIAVLFLEWNVDCVHLVHVCHGNVLHGHKALAVGLCDVGKANLLRLTCAHQVVLIHVCFSVNV